MEDFSPCQLHGYLPGIAQRDIEPRAVVNRGSMRCAKEGVLSQTLGIHFHKVLKDPKVKIVVPPITCHMQRKTSLVINGVDACGVLFYEILNDLVRSTELARQVQGKTPFIIRRS